MKKSGWMRRSGARIEYDNNTDATYIRLRDTKILESEELSPGVIADFDADNNLVGIEILFTKTRTPESLKQIGLELQVQDREALGSIFKMLAGAFA